MRTTITRLLALTTVFGLVAIGGAAVRRRHAG